MTSPLRTVAVSYLNTYPFLYGLQHAGLDRKVRLLVDTPAGCARKLQQDEADIGLVPVGALHELPETAPVTPYCIASHRRTDTVGIFSECPPEEMEEILLDYQSRTSVQLVRILMQHHWQQNVRYRKARPGYEKDIGGRTGGLIIGDRAIRARSQFPFYTDLGTAWYEMTGLPFVYALWVSRGKVAPGLATQLGEAFETGIRAIPELTKQWQGGKLDKQYYRGITASDAPGFDLQAYLTDTMHYRLDGPAQKALVRFHALCESAAVS